MNNLDILLTALHKIDANAAESPEWIRRTAKDALAAVLPDLTPITDPGNYLIKLAPGEYRPATNAEARAGDSRQIHEHLEAILKSLGTRPQHYQPGDTLYNLLQKASNTAISDAEAALGIG